MEYIKTKVNKILLAVLAIVLIIILLLIYEENQTYENKGEYLINKIENFRTTVHIMRKKIVLII